MLAEIPNYIDIDDLVLLEKFGKIKAESSIIPLQFLRACRLKFHHINPTILNKNSGASEGDMALAYQKTANNIFGSDFGNPYVAQYAMHYGISVAKWKEWRGTYIMNDDIHKMYRELISSPPNSQSPKLIERADDLVGRSRDYEQELRDNAAFSLRRVLLEESDYMRRKLVKPNQLTGAIKYMESYFSDQRHVSRLILIASE